MLIRSLGLDGFLSFAPASEAIELRPLNVLIGPNGSGKSNLIEALDLLSAAPGDLAHAVRAGGGAIEWLWKGDPRPSELGITAVLDRGSTPTGRDLRYQLNLSSVQTRLELVDEAIEEVTRQAGKDDVYFYYRFQRGHPVINVSSGDGKIWVGGGKPTARRLLRQDLLPDQSVLAQRKDPEQYPEVTWVGKAFSGIQVHRDWTFGRDTVVRHAQRTDLPEDQLLPEGRNLALVLNHLEHVGDRQINELLRQFFPRFERLSIRISSGTAQLYMFETGFKTPVPATRLSDGTLRFLTLLATLISRSPPPLLCIEEPELGLHPDAVALLAEVLVDASSRTQLVVTTHSDALVSALSDQPDAIVACERPGASTVLRRLDPEKLASWLEDYRLGDLWGMGVLGANP